jgi:hypothetical protein
MSSNPFQGYTSMLASAAQRHGVLVTPSDTTDLFDPAFGTGEDAIHEIAIGLRIEIGGVLNFYDNSDVPTLRTITVESGEIVFGAIKRVLATDTTADDITAYFMGQRP